MTVAAAAAGAPASKNYKIKHWNIYKHIGLDIQVVGVVMMTSAILYGVERGLNDGEGTGSFNEPGWQWHDAFYFTIVTLSTVG